MREMLMVGISTFRSDNHFHVVFLGSPLVDITARVEDDFLLKYKLEPDRAYVSNEETLSIFSEISKLKPRITVGGSVTNTVRVFKDIVKDTSDIRVIYLGAIGDDDDGRFIRAKLEEEEIGLGFIEIVGESTGKVAVLIRGHCRTLITDLGASRTFTLNHPTQWDAIIKSRCFYVSAFFLGVSYEVVKKICRNFEENKKKIAINLGAPFLSRKYKEEMEYLYEKADVIFGNESEHEAFCVDCMSVSPSVENLENSIQIILKSYKNCKLRTAVVTRGPKPIWVVTSSKIVEFDVVISEDFEIVNTNGAGDAFVGGFLANFVLNKSTDVCVASGIKEATKCISSNNRN